jgi:hypothetical protein
MAKDAMLQEALYLAECDIQKVSVSALQRAIKRLVRECERLETECTDYLNRLEEAHRELGRDI